MLFQLKTFILILFISQLAFAGDPLWIDVRSEAEYQAHHIEGDERIGFQNIVAALQAKGIDTNTEIHLYCRSGRRASIAKSNLEQAGYENVFNAGSIENAEKLRHIKK